MIYPKFIYKGSKIGVTAPSAGCENDIDCKRLDFAINNMEEQGYVVKESENCRKNINGRSSEGKERAKQLEELYIDNDIDVIIGLSGGEFLLEMLSYLNFDIIKQNPKWLQGYSDITGLLFPITTNLDIATIYSNNFKTFGMKEWHKSLYDNMNLLEGKELVQTNYDMYEGEREKRLVGNEGYNLTQQVKWEGINNETNMQIKGRIIGGCLDIIISLIGTRFDKTVEFLERYKDDGIIWFFDNCEIGSEGIIRAMWQLKEGGYFKYTKGIVFGRSGIEKSYYNTSFKEAVQTAFAEYNFPIILNADIGHKPPMISIVNGAIAEIELKNGKGKVEFNLE